ncbi:hypothetical protein [Streptomyces sp. NPDC015345]
MEERTQGPGARTLLDVVPAIGSDLDLEVVLRRIARSAAALASTRSTGR